MHFCVRTENPIDMDVGTVIEYDLRIRGVPVRWQSLISRWDPPISFEDEQIRGPYLRWYRIHEFEDSVTGTVVRDTVRYRVLGGRLVNRLFVAPDLRRIFSYQHERILAIFNSEVPSTIVGGLGGTGTILDKVNGTLGVMDLKMENERYSKLQVNAVVAATVTAATAFTVTLGVALYKRIYRSNIQRHIGD